MEGVFWQAPELGQPDLCQPLKSFYRVDVHLASGELIFRMIDAEVTISQIDQTSVAAPTIGVHHPIGINFSSDDPLSIHGGL